VLATRQFPDGNAGERDFDLHVAEPTANPNQPRVRIAVGSTRSFAIAPQGNGILFVDDNGSANTLDILH